MFASRFLCDQQLLFIHPILFIIQAISKLRRTCMAVSLVESVAFDSQHHGQRYRHRQNMPPAGIEPLGASRGELPTLNAPLQSIRRLGQARLRLSLRGRSLCHAVGAGASHWLLPPRLPPPTSPCRTSDEISGGPGSVPAFPRRRSALRLLGIRTAVGCRYASDRRRHRLSSVPRPGRHQPAHLGAGVVGAACWPPTTATPDRNSPLDPPSGQARKAVSRREEGRFDIRCWVREAGEIPWNGE